VISKTHEDFWAGFDALPKAVQKLAGKIPALAEKSVRSVAAFQGTVPGCLVGSRQSKLPRARTAAGQFDRVVLDWHACGI
jgi:hypothetical protein